MFPAASLPGLQGSSIRPVLYCHPGLEQAKSKLFPSPVLLCPASVISCGLSICPALPMAQGSPQQPPSAFIILPLPPVTICILPGTPMTTGIQLDFSPSKMGLDWERNELFSSVISFLTLFLFSSRCSFALLLTREAEWWQAVLLSRERRGQEGFPHGQVEEIPIFQKPVLQQQLVGSNVLGSNAVK